MTPLDKNGARGQPRKIHTTIVTAKAMAQIGMLWLVGLLINPKTPDYLVPS